MDHNTSSQFSVLSSQGRRGYTLLFAILVMGIVSIATINLASIVLRSLRSAHDLDDATVALYAAESGNEEALYFLGQGASCASLTTGAEIALSNGATFKRVCSSDATQMLIRSTGSFGTAKMALQVKIPL